MLIVLSCQSFLEIYSKKMKLLNAPGIFPLSRCSPTYVSISLRWELRLLLINWGMRNILYNGILHCAFSIENFGFSTMNFIHSTSESWNKKVCVCGGGAIHNLALRTVPILKIFVFQAEKSSCIGRWGKETILNGLDRYLKTLI